MFTRGYLTAAGIAAALGAALEFRRQETLNALVLKSPAAFTAAAAAIIAGALTFLIFWLYAGLLEKLSPGTRRDLFRRLTAFAAALGTPLLWFAAYHHVLPAGRHVWLAALGLGLLVALALAIPVGILLSRPKIAAAVGITSVIVLAAVGVRAAFFNARPAGDLRPHVILFTLSSTRPDRLGCYGAADARTPRLDALAARGFRFSRAVCLEPLTAPSHATIMTSLHPKTSGVRLDGDFVPADAPTLATCFAAAGYETAAFVGGAPLRADNTGLSRGFKTYDDGMTPEERYRSTPFMPRPVATEFSLLAKDGNDAERPAGAVTKAAARWLKGRNRGRPFFLWANYYDPHADYLPPSYYVPAGVGGPFTRKRWNEKWAAGVDDDRTGAIIATLYNGEIAYTDAALGRLVDAVAAATPGEPLIILVVGDHGEAFREHGTIYHGNRLYREEINVPFVVAAFHHELPAVAGDAGVVSTLDVAPTLLSLAGLPVPPSMQGRRLFKPGVLPAAAYAVRVPEPGRRNLFNAGPLEAWVTTTEKIIVGAAGAEYYELARDPGETANLAAEKADRVAALAEAMTAFRNSLPRAERARE